MSSTITSYPIVLSAIGFFCILALFPQTKPKTNPPGPKPLPLIGNVLDFPQVQPWITFSEWKKQYGDVIFMNMLGTRMVILNSLSACTELLEKRSSKYSGRPRSIMLTDLIGFDFSFPLMDYSPRWRKHRRLFHQYFNENEVLNYRLIQEQSVAHFLHNLLTTPDQFLGHIRLLFGETILDVVYDIKIRDSNSIFVKTAEKAIAIALEAAIPGQFLVDIFPPLKYIPSWSPGGRFKRLASEWRKTTLDLKNLAFDYTKKRTEEGTAGPSVAISMLERCNEESIKSGTHENESPEDCAKGCAAVAYLGGADTTLSTIQAFFMVIANHQDLQLEAQKELDALLTDGGRPTRLPTFADKSQLPFINAIVKELMRWHNVLPMGVPHVLTEDDEYNGYMLQKGTIIFPNTWHILRDPDIYPNPLTFNPRRWLINTPEGSRLNPNMADPDIAFGFGRRICPGRHLALNSLFITVASVLACFDIYPVDADGKLTESVDEAFTDGLLIYPAPYRISINPRSSHLAQLIRDSNIS